MQYLYICLLWLHLLSFYIKHTDFCFYVGILQLFLSLEKAGKKLSSLFFYMHNTYFFTTFLKIISLLFLRGDLKACLNNQWSADELTSQWSADDQCSTDALPNQWRTDDLENLFSAGDLKNQLTADDLEMAMWCWWSEKSMKCRQSWKSV